MPLCWMKSTPDQKLTDEVQGKIFAVAEEYINCSVGDDSAGASSAEEEPAEAE